MKKFLLVLSIYVLQIWGAYAQDKNVELLKITYKKGFVSKGKDSILYQNAFFNAFPSNFKSFKKIYGWNDVIDKPGPLYDFYLEHIGHFFQLKNIDENVFIKKVIGVAINGEWEADGVGYFQQNIMQYVKLYNKKFLKALKAYKKDEVVSVWTFYFDYENSFHRKENYIKALKFSLNDKTMQSYITTGYEKASKSNGHH